MSKLIVEMEMNGIPDCCGLCDPLFAAVCALKHDQTIDEMMLRVGRPSWCPIKGEISEIELMHLEEERAFAARNIAAERKDDGTKAD